MENIKESVEQKTDSNLDKKQDKKQVEIKKTEENTFEKNILSEATGTSEKVNNEKVANSESKTEEENKDTEKKPVERTEQLISKDKLLEYGTHYGHETRRWNPAMKPFIAKAQKMTNSRKQIHMISPAATAMTLENSYNAISSIATKGGTFLFVGTNKRAEKTIQENAERAGVFYVNHRWLGGTLTNFRTIQNSVKKLRMLERLEKNEFDGYTKKEALHMAAELAKLEKSLGGIKYMRRLPTAIFVTSIFEEDIAIKEADKLRIPVFGIADTNVDPAIVRFPIVANDDANKSIALITTLIADAIVEAKGGTAMVAHQLDENVEVMGIEEMPIRKPQARQNSNRQPVRKYSNKPTEKQIRVLTNNGFTAEGVTFAMANEAISIIAANEWKLKGKEKEVSEILKQEPKKREFKKYSGKPKSTTEKVAVKKDTEDKSVNMESTNEYNAQISEKMQALKEKAIRLNAHDFKLIDIKGIGVKTVEYMHENNIDTIGDLINLNKNLHQGLVAGLPGIKLEAISIKNIKFINFLEQAHLFLDSKEVEAKAPIKVSEGSTEEQTDMLIIKEHDDEISAKMQALKAKAIQLDAHDLKLIDIKGIGEKTVEYLQKNNISTIGDLINLDKDTHKELISGLPGLKSETAPEKNLKFINFLEQAHLFLDAQSGAELNNEHDEIISSKLKVLKEKAIRFNAHELKLSDIKGIGSKTIEYMHKNNIDTIGDLINLDANGRQGLVAGLPGIKLEAISIKNIKFIEFLEQAHLFLEQEGLEGVKGKLAGVKAKIVEAKKASKAEEKPAEEKLIEEKPAEEKLIEEKSNEEAPKVEEELVFGAAPVDEVIIAEAAVTEDEIVIEGEAIFEAAPVEEVAEQKNPLAEDVLVVDVIKKAGKAPVLLSLEFNNLKNHVEENDAGATELTDLKDLNPEMIEHLKKCGITSLDDLVTLSEEAYGEIVHALPGEEHEAEKKHSKFRNMLTEIHNKISEDIHKLTTKK